MIDNAGQEEREQQVAALGHRIGLLTAHINALSVELATAVGEFDAIGGWEGFRSMAQWLGVRAGWRQADATRLATVGARMELIPTLAAAAARGEVSLGMLDAAARVSTPENEAVIAEMVLLCTPSQAARVLSTYRTVKDQPLPGDCMNPDPSSPEGTHSHHGEHNYWWREWIDAAGRGRIDAALDPLTLEQIRLARAAHQNSQPDPTNNGNTPDVESDPTTRPKQASTIELMARVAHAALTQAERTGARDVGNELYRVQVHADLATVAEVLGIALDPSLPVGLSRQAFMINRNGTTTQLSDAQLAEAICSSTLQLLIHEAGVPLWLGNETRNATRHQRRALNKRATNTCEYPGCATTRHLEAHHVTFHSKGGATDLDNLLLLCWHHHHQLHRNQFQIRHVAHQTFAFYDRHGSCLGSNTMTGPQPDTQPLHFNKAPDCPQPAGETPSPHLRITDPTAARPKGGGEPLTQFGLDVFLHNLLSAA